MALSQRCCFTFSFRLNLSMTPVGGGWTVCEYTIGRLPQASLARLSVHWTVDLPFRRPPSSPERSIQTGWAFAIPQSNRPKRPSYSCGCIFGAEARVIRQTCSFTYWIAESLAFLGGAFLMARNKWRLPWSRPASVFSDSLKLRKLCECTWNFDTNVLSPQLCLSCCAYIT